MLLAKTIWRTPLILWRAQLAVCGFECCIPWLPNKLIILLIIGERHSASHILVFSKICKSLRQSSTFKGMNILSFIPQAVRNQLVKPPRQYPYIDTFSDGIVAIIDISGYSNLSSRLQESLGADSGAKIKELLNPPIEVIVQTVHRSGGSIVKFAGDAVIAIWNHSCESDDVTREMASHAFVCCLDLLAYFKDFSITFEEPVRAECGLNYSLEIRPSTLTLPRGALRQSATTTPCLSSGITNNIVPMTNITGQSVTVVHSLKIHIGLGYGVVQQVHLGIYENGLLSRSEFFVSGKALDDAGALLGLGKQGDFVFRSKFWQLFAPNNSELKFITLNDSDGDPAFLLNELMDLAGLQSIQNLTGNFDQSILHSGSEDSPLLLETCHEIQLSAALPYIDDALAQAMSDAKVAIDSNLAPQCFIENLQMNTDIFLKRYDQTRNVTLVFILLSDFNVTTIAEGTNLKKLQECMAVIMKSVRKYQGCLRQINCDDKSLTALLVWGLPGFAHEKDEALFALPAALEIHSRLEATLGSKFSMGATSGIVFAGIVGNASRADGTVLGVAVNNAARIMCLKICNGLLLVDEAVFTAAHEAYDFDEGIPEVYLKGAGNRKLYRPVKRRQEKVTGSDVAPIGGRENELMVIRETIANWTQMKRQRLVITGRSGAGKSTLMNYSLRLLSQDPNVIVW
ncbi:hypothetical protein BC830DRAFT_21404 [Chytriomyces sp. MP71]|nr:hypothetical protein BC830DRAFT_21404 [Chytriomyces sp. MP71]